MRTVSAAGGMFTCSTISHCVECPERKALPQHSSLVKINETYSPITIISSTPASRLPDLELERALEVVLRVADLHGVDLDIARALLDGFGEPATATAEEPAEPAA